MIELILISMIVGAVAGLLRAVRVADREGEIICKTAASLTFVVLGGIAWRSGDPIAGFIVAGLALCAVGDVLLLCNRGFDAGLVSFVLGHVAYIVAFHHALPITGWPRWLVLPVALTSAGALSWLWPHLGSKKAAVSAYIVVITAMVWGALAVTAAGVVGWTVAAGATLFYLSDLTVARQRFVHADFANRALGLPLYYAAQVLIALSI